MNIKIFQPAPDNANFTLPFKLTQTSFDVWFNGLNERFMLENTEQIFLAIQAVNKQDSLNKVKMSDFLKMFFRKISIKLKPIKKTILNSALPLSEKEQYLINYLLWIYIEFSYGFNRCINNEKNEQNAASLFYGLESLIFIYLHSLTTYQQPHPDFWKQSYFFYGTASRFGIENLVINNINFCEAKTVTEAFKHLLALYHCDLAQFRPRDIWDISEDVEKHHELMVLGKEFEKSKGKQYSVLDLNIGKAPVSLKYFTQKDKSAFRFFSGYEVSVDIIRKVKENDDVDHNNVFDYIERNNKIQVAKALSLSQTRKVTRINNSNDTLSLGIFGFSHIIAALAINSTLPDTYQLKFKSLSEAKDLELLDEEDDYIAPSFFQKIGSFDPNIDVDVNIERVKENNVKLHVIDYSFKGYKIMIDIKDISVSERMRTWDLIAIRNEGGIEIGLIQRIMQLENHKIQLGVKLLSLGVELVYVSTNSSSSDDIWGLLLSPLDTNSSYSSLILQHNNFKLGEYIDIYSERFVTVQSYQLYKFSLINYAFTQILLKKA